MTDADTRLGALLGRYEEMRQIDPDATISALKKEAGPLYDELVELAACLDQVAAHTPSTAAPVAAPRARWPYALGAVAAVVGAWALLEDRGDDAGAAAPTRAEVSEVPIPADPFDAEEVRAFARAHGIAFSAPRATFPAPTDALPAMSAAADDVIDAAIIALELARLPAAVRGSAAARYVAAERLYRAGHYREAHHVAATLSKEFPDRREPLALVLHALWGLERVQSDEYAKQYARYLSLD